MNIDTRYGYLGLALALVHRPASAIEVFSHYLDTCRLTNKSPQRQAEALAKRANADIDWHETESHLGWEQSSADNHIVLPHDPDFPNLLRNINDCPSILFIKGRRTSLVKPQVAVIGSRKATHHGLANARDLSALLSKAGFVVTSGLAIGIDAACHQAALAAGAETIAVLGCGMNVDYPRRHRSLRENIAEHGAIVSEFPLNATPKPFHFPRRNRIISGLSIAVIVVEATRKSGSLTTAMHAAAQGRDVYAVPGSIRHPSSSGCNQLIGDGAQIVFESAALVESLNQSASLYYPSFKPAAAGFANSRSEASVGDKNGRTMKAIERRILSLMGAEPIGFDQLVTLSGLTSSELSSILSSLELDGFIHALAGNAYSLA